MQFADALDFVMTLVEMVVQISMDASSRHHPVAMAARVSMPLMTSHASAHAAIRGSVVNFVRACFRLSVVFSFRMLLPWCVVHCLLELRIVDQNDLLRLVHCSRS